MESFIVSARKYRPAIFKTVVGQDTITTTLKNAIRSEHLAQSFLFCGPRGVGKTTCARILAKTINCQNLTADFEACDVCESCKSFRNNSSFNIYELDAASNNSVDDIRSLIEQVRIPPQVGKYKVYIIDEVHMLSAAAFNAFLKTLEEPPAYAKFILATTEKHKIIPTILSRCQVYDFKRISVTDIVKHLQYVAASEQVEAETDALHIIACKADGALRDALSIFDQLVSFSGKILTYQGVITSLNVLDSEIYYKLTRSLLSGDLHQALKIFDEIISNGFDGQHFIVDFGAYLRNLMIVKDPKTLQLLEVSDIEKAHIEEQSPLCSVGYLIKCIEIVNQCDINYRTSNNKRLIIELALMQMGTQHSSESASKQSADLQKKTPDVELNNVSEPVKAVYSELKPIEISKGKVQAAINQKDNVSIKISAPESQMERAVKEEMNTLASEDDQALTRLSTTELLVAWEEMIQSFSGESPTFITALTHHQLSLNEDGEIILPVDNKLQEGEINMHRQDICEFIKNKLNIYTVKFNVLINNEKGKELIYSPQDKFRKMAEKNPALLHFRNELNLDLDY